MNTPWGKLKFKHHRKGRLYGRSKDKYKLYENLKMYTYGLKLLENAYITQNQINAAVKVLKRYSRKITRKPQNLSIFIRGHLFLARSKKKKGMRMGGSKGPFNRLVFMGRAGSTLLEVREIFFIFPLAVLRLASKKFSARVEIIKYTFKGL
jgi:ribosomal protein L16/L10AE